jgi:hypothetical protein
MSELDVRPSAESIRATADRVSLTLQDVVAQLALPSRTPKDLARRLDVHRTVASRLLAALRMSDSLAVVANLPGRQGLNAILQSAENIIGAELVGEAQAALLEFESLVENDLGGRDALDVALRAWLPESRDKHELACRQQIYRGTCGLVGASAEVTIGAMIRFPSEDPDYMNQVLLYGLVGLRRLCPGTDIPIGNLGFIPGTQTPRGSVIENLPGSPDPQGAPLITEFSTVEAADLREMRLGNYRQFVLPGEDVGVRSQQSIFTGLFIRNLGPRYRDATDPPLRTGCAQMVEVPTRVLVMDFYVDESEMPVREPAIWVHRVGQRGGVDPNDPHREIDRMRALESVQLLGRGPERFGTSDVPRFPELIRHVCSQIGVDSSRLVGHRSRVEYPVPNYQFSAGFELPVRNGTSGRT